MAGLEKVLHPKVRGDLLKLRGLKFWHQKTESDMNLGSGQMSFGFPSSIW